VLDRQRRAADSLQLDSVMYCWRFNLQTGRTQEGPLDDLPVEFPRIDDGLAGSPTQYGYAVSLDSGATTFVKHDFSGGSTVRRRLGRGRIAGEGVFVPRSGRRCEDDGYLVAFGHDLREDRSELLVMDCRDFDQPPVARVVMPRRVPAGFHALWLPGAVR
jgi:carotenoid cleavage dioxygenase